MIHIIRLRAVSNTTSIQQPVKHNGSRLQGAEKKRQGAGKTQKQKQKLVQKDRENEYDSEFIRHYSIKNILNPYL